MRLKQNTTLSIKWFKLFKNTIDVAIRDDHTVMIHWIYLGDRIMEDFSSLVNALNVVLKLLSKLEALRTSNIYSEILKAMKENVSTLNKPWLLRMKRSNE